MDLTVNNPITTQDIMEADMHNTQLRRDFLLQRGWVLGEERSQPVVGTCATLWTKEVGSATWAVTMDEAVEIELDAEREAD